MKIAKKSDQKPGVKTNLDALRHTTAHVLAYAVKKMFPAAKFAIGPVIDTGFYYDFELPRALTPEDLPRLEKSMKEIIRQNLPMEKIVVPFDKAIAAAKQSGQKYKLELLEEIKAGKRETPDATVPHGSVTFYRVGEFTDLCRGNHAASTADLPADAFKLTHIAGAYWKGDERREQLQRVYGALFASREELEEYLKQLEEAKRRDHKKLGRELNLFLFHPTAPGMPYWLPKGMAVLNELINFWRQEHASAGYQEISSPMVNKKELWLTSGHFEHFWQDMFTLKVEGEEYGLKAMNCPNAMIVFGSKTRSYKDLPLRFSDTDILHRYEASGVLNGLLRARSFRQDDAHNFIAEEQIEEEYARIFEIAKKFYGIFNLSYRYRLGTRPEKFLGDEKTWNEAETALKHILDKTVKKESYEVLEGDGAFYGPKVDILMKDSLGRDWQMGTIQLDFHQPRRFNLTYAAANGSLKNPVVIHRVIYGSLERFIGILIEHYAGALPTWLAPVQVIVLPISDKLNKYANKVADELRTPSPPPHAGEGRVRVEVDLRNESVGKKIREAELQKIPYMLVVGEKEQNSKKVNVRKRGEQKQKVSALSTFLKKIKKEIEQKK